VMSMLLEAGGAASVWTSPADIHVEFEGTFESRR